MTVRTSSPASPRRGTRPSLLDVAAEVLVADPAASLAEVAEAAGIGRTTLHKHYPTRDDLLRAVGDRALDLWEHAVAGITAAEDPDGGLRAVIAAMIPIGPQLAFLWRTPAFDHITEIGAQWCAVEAATAAILKRAQSLARLEATIALRMLAERMPGLARAGTVKRRNATTIRGPLRVPVAAGQAPPGRPRREHRASR